MHAAVKQPAAADRVVTRGGFGHVSQLCQRIARVLKRMTPILQRLQYVDAEFRGRRCLDWPGIGRRQDWDARPIESRVPAVVVKSKKSGKQAGHVECRSLFCVKSPAEKSVSPKDFWMAYGEALCPPSIQTLDSFLEADND